MKSPATLARSGRGPRGEVSDVDEGTGGAPAEPSVGERIKREREQAGMSRAVLGGLVGRSVEWVKAVENGRLRTPRLQMLIEIAGALGLTTSPLSPGTAGRSRSACTPE